MKTLRFAILAGMFVTSLLGAEPIKTLEFRNQDLKDILLTFGELNKVSIVPDDTVEGRASYVFANMEFAQALQVFLDTYNWQRALAIREDPRVRVLISGL